MSIDVPTPGNLIKTVSELVVSVNGSGSANQIVLTGPNMLITDADSSDFIFDTLDPDGDGSTGGTTLQWNISTPTLVKVLKDGNYAVSGTGSFSAETAGIAEYLQIYVKRYAIGGNVTELGPSYWIVTQEPRITNKRSSISWSMILPMLADQSFALSVFSSMGGAAVGTVNGSFVALGPI